MPRWILTLLFIALPISAHPVNAQNRAAIPVDLELVLAVDISTSVDSVESRLQRKGYVDAMLDGDVLAAIQRGVLGRIAITYVEWAGARLGGFPRDFTFEILAADNQLGDARTAHAAGE
jgi:hypothetical protein